MPLLIIALGLAAVVVAYRLKLFTPQQPEVEVTQEDLLKSEFQRTAERVTSQLTSGRTITNFQQEQIKKFSSYATLAGTAGTLAITGVTSLSLAAATPIGAAITAAIVAFGVLRGTAHLVANEWTTKVQYPFDRVLIALVDEKDRVLREGGATKQMMGDVTQTIRTLWSRYYLVAEQFASLDKDHRLVIDQSYCWYIAQRCEFTKLTPDPRFPEGFLNRVLNDIAKQSAALPL